MIADCLQPDARRRFESCIALAKHGATAGERAAGKAAAERIAVAAGLTLAEARKRSPGVRLATSGVNWTPSPGWASSAAQPGRSHPRATPRKPQKPPTVADRLREKAEEAVSRRRRAAAADRRFEKNNAAHAAWEAEQRGAQAERDRAWAASRATAATHSGPGTDGL